MEPASAASCSPATPSPASTQVCPSLRQVATVRPCMSKSRTDVPAASTSTPRRGDVERLAADDRVGDLAAVLDVVDGRRGPPADLAAVAAGGAPALRRPGRERDPVLRDPESAPSAAGAAAEAGRPENAAASSTVGPPEATSTTVSATAAVAATASESQRPRRRCRPRAWRSRSRSSDSRRPSGRGPRPRRRGSARGRGAAGRAPRRSPGRAAASASSSRVPDGVERAVGGSRELRHQAVVEGFGRRHGEAVRQQGDERLAPAYS